MLPPPPFVVSLEVTRAALAHAAALHAGQRPDSDFPPFILHPPEDANLVDDRSCDDAVDNTEATPTVIEERFGPRIADLVAALSDDPAIEDRAERKRALREQVRGAGPDAQAIFAADKVAKARELRATVTRDPARADDPAIRLRLEHYEASLAMLEEQTPDLPLVRQLRFELWALRELPPPR